MSVTRLQLAADATTAATPILGRHGINHLPAWPYGTITTLLTLPRHTLHPDDITDALTVIIALRHWLNWIEFRHLRRAAHAHYLIPTNQHALAGDLLGINKPGLTQRRQRLARLIAEHRHVKNSPKLPRIDLPTAQAAAEQLLDHREGHIEAIPPDPSDLIGVAAYAATWPDTPLLTQHAADIRAALTVVVALRRHLDDLEADLLDLGRTLGISNTELGKPFGRLGIRATWKARARLRTGDRAGRRRRIDAPPREDPIPSTPTRSTLDTELDTRTRAAINDLLDYRPVINDDDLDVWLGWLADHATQPLTKQVFGLLWATADEIINSHKARKIPGLTEAAEQVLHLTQTVRGHDITESTP